MGYGNVAPAPVIVSALSAHRTPATARTTKSSPAIRFMLHLRLKLLYLFPGKLSMFPDCYGIVTVASLLVESVAACKPTSMLKTLPMRGLGPCEERVIGIGGRSPPRQQEDYRQANANRNAKSFLCHNL